MLFILSPAKKLDFESAPAIKDFTLPAMMDQTEVLVAKLKKMSAKKLGELMKLSADLSKLNYDRFQEWSPEFSLDESRQALLAFKGDVFKSMNVEAFKKADFNFAQKHLRILSGLHGVLRPLDLIRPYRLEMGTKLSVDSKTKNLYQFWGAQIAESVNLALAEQKDKVLVNVASNEYFKAVDKKTLDAEVIDVSFKDLKSGVYKSVFLWVKQARGMMASWAIRNRIKKVSDLQSFSENGYHFSKKDSSDNSLVFLRDEPV